MDIKELQSCNIKELQLKFLTLQDLIRIGILSADDNVLNCMKTISIEYKKRLEIEIEVDS